MRISTEGAERGTPLAEPVPGHQSSASLLDAVLEGLDDAKAEDVVSIDLRGKTSIGDVMVVASGRSHRHVGAIADQLLTKLKNKNFARARIEGMPHCYWVLIDAGDVIVHHFRADLHVANRMVAVGLWVTLPDSDAVGHELTHGRLKIVVANHTTCDARCPSGDRVFVNDEDVIAAAGAACFQLQCQMVCSAQAMNACTNHQVFGRSW